MPYFLLIVVLGLLSTSKAQRERKASSESWQNPDIGLVADMIADLHDAEDAYQEWRTSGVNIRGVELDISSNIDPFAFLQGNVLFSESGAELHEAYALFPALPGNLKARMGLLLADFGRWSQFHTHAMPFAGEPRIYLEYVGGVLALRGVEVSWLTPLPHYLEWSVSLYDGIRGHTHDRDPVSEPKGLSSKGGFPTAEEIARNRGCAMHGNHWDCPDGIYFEEDLLSPAGAESQDPTTSFENQECQELALGTRLNTAFDMGLDWSLDAGASALYQHGFKRSVRLPGLKYPKGLVGLDVTFFWHPLNRNKYRNAEFGVEILYNYEGFESRRGSVVLEEYLRRGGFITHARYMLNPNWRLGGFAELFQARSGEDFLKKRYGVFMTYAITHYQFLRLELSRFERAEALDPLHRIVLQYDAVIGFHAHGRRR